MIELGTKREDVKGSDVLAATFHPFQDVWWIVCLAKEEEWEGPALATFENGVCNQIDCFATVQDATQALIERWSDEH